MADLSSIEATEAVRIVGSANTGAEQTPVQSTASGALHSNLRDASGNEILSFDLDNTGNTAKVLGVSVRSLSNGEPIEAGNASNPFRVDPTGTTVQPVSQNGTWTVQPGNTANTTPWRTTVSWGGADAVVTASTVNTASAGMAVRPIAYEPATFSAFAEAVVLANGKSLIAIQNTGTSVIKIKQVWLVNDRTTSVTGVVANFRLVRIASFTGGTAITPGTMDTLDSLPAGISIATGATISTPTTVYRTHYWSTDEWGPGTMDQEGYDHGVQYSTPFYEHLSGTKPITLRQNQGLHLLCNTNTTAGQFNLRIVFTQE